MENKGLLDTVLGDKPIKFEISVDWESVGMLAGGAFVIGLLLILISKKVIK